MNILLFAIIGLLFIAIAEVTYLVYVMATPRIKAKDRVILVDTSVLMDGRIVSIAGTHFIGGTLVVPRSVVGELQLLADQSDSDRRARARGGLDVVSQLQAMPGITVELLQDGSRAKEGVDERLLKLAKQHNASICTIDYNLNKVAAVEGIEVLNVNELSQAIRMAHLPGETMLIDLVQKGQEHQQAIGYLPDGTMVVVEHAQSSIGKTVKVEVVRSLQTAAGKMMFAKLSGTTQSSSSSQKNTTPASPRKKDTKPAEQKSPKPYKQQARKSVKKTRGRVDREASLIELVDNQPD